MPQGQSAFLWGPRKVGKSYWITHHLPRATLIDLLKTDVFADYVSRPALLRERYLNHRGLIVIDEIQKVPALLDEVHWLIENKRQSFLAAEALTKNIPAFSEFLRMAAITSSERQYKFTFSPFRRRAGEEMLYCLPGK